MIFYKGKHFRSSDRKYMQNAVPLFLGMLFCMSCLAGGTWAWLSANQTTPVQFIQSAQYSVAVEVSDASTEIPIEVNEAENVTSCTLTTNTSYSVTLTPYGTATKGYCLITDGDKVYTTGQLWVNTTFVFTYNNGLADEFETAEEYDELINNTTGKNIAIAWYWGEYPNALSQMIFSMEEPILLENGSVIGQPIAERPEEKATLSLQLTNMTANMESGELAVGTDCVITFTADEGYTLPESIMVEGVEIYTYVYGVYSVLIIPADQVQEGTKIVVTAAGMADPTESPTTEPTTEQETPPMEGDTTPTEPDTSPTEENTTPTEPTAPDEGNTVPTDPPTNPIEEETASPESTTAPVEDDTTPAEPPAALSVDDIPTTESSGSTAPAASTPESTEGASPDESIDIEE